MKVFLFYLLFSLPVYANTELATFAGGCFWCMEATFERLEGVLTVVSGLLWRENYESYLRASLNR